jgi:diadenosine tetraphosphate (Ap4A) HIT family hydrolase
VRGWVVVYLRRHAAGLTDMSAAELRSMGPTLATAASAIERVLEPERVYSLMFGENVPHVHVVLVPRGKDVPPEHRSAALHVNAKLYADPQRAQEVAQRIRRALDGASPEDHSTHPAQPHAGRSI